MGSIHQVWGEIVDKVISNDQGAFLIRFTFEDDLRPAMGRGPLLSIYGVNSLAKLPVKYWVALNFSRIVSQVGKLKMTDQKTASRDRVEYARVLVEVALNNPLLDEVTFEDQHGCDFILPRVWMETYTIFCMQDVRT